MISSHHCDRLRPEDLGHGERGVEGDVGQDVDHGHQDAADGDGAGKVLDRVLKRLDNLFILILSRNNKGK